MGGPAVPLARPFTPAGWVSPQGVILCFGLCARGQVKTVLNVLHDFEERIQESEQSWQIGAWRKDHPWRRETVKSALMVMYSCVASHCHPQMLLTHADNPITSKIIHHYTSSCQDICLKMAFMKSVAQVTSAIKNIKDLEDFQFGQKTTLTAIVMAIIKAEPIDTLVSPVRAMAMDALSHLSKVKPFYSSEENSELMDISIHSLISLQPPGEDNESIKLLEKWILSEKEWEREKAMNLHLRLMQIYVQSVGVCIPLKLGQFGALVGLIAPCTCDSHKRTRMASMDVLSSLLDLHASQTCSSWGASKELELAKCKEDLQDLDVEKIFSASSRIAKVACMQFNCDEVVSLIQKLCENIGAMDLQHDKASVTWIGTFLQMRVKELEDKVAEILGAILVHLPVVEHPEVRRLLIEGIILLAHHHQDPVLTSLLRQPLPMERLCVRHVEGSRHRLSELVLRGMASEVLSCRVSSTAVCVEFMSDPTLYREKLLKPAVLLLGRGADQEDETLRVLSLRALGNMALGAPKKVRQYRKLLLEKCLCALREPGGPGVPSEAMDALARILAELREGDLGSSLDAISERCRAFFDNDSELLRVKAFLLFGKLANVVRVSKRHFFKEEVKKAWVPLMLHCQDPCSEAAQACMATMYRCVHFWGFKALEDASRRSDASGADEMTVFQMTLCSVLT
ncbi:maestro heat-like repeat-containing protein family member 2A [Pteropus vampyrus]|uniref:Maestro heat-like repeat-containing protein family member 2A n=1 Tax=Pteropus vampyrus TaxID=132908 RepID=A0A6P3QVL9_PTEVA|nr:maestro heat-like repeat-containing protein family member 2A [Pteropus vampyrus]